MPDSANAPRRSNGAVVPTDVTPPEVSRPSNPDTAGYQCPHYSDSSMDDQCDCRDNAWDRVTGKVDLTAGRCPDCGHEVTLIKLPLP